MLQLLVQGPWGVLTRPSHWSCGNSRCITSIRFPFPNKPWFPLWAHVIPGTLTPSWPQGGSSQSSCHLIRVSALSLTFLGQMHLALPLEGNGVKMWRHEDIPPEDGTAPTGAAEQSPEHLRRQSWVPVTPWASGGTLPEAWHLWPFRLCEPELVFCCLSVWDAFYVKSCKYVSFF